MPRWYDKAVAEIEDALAAGEISQSEFSEEMRALNAEVRAEADSVAEQAREEFFDGW